MHPLPVKYKFRLLISGKKSTPAVYTGAWGKKRGRNWGCLRNVCICTRGKNVSASSDGKKSLQDTGFPVIIVFYFLFNFFHVRESGVWFFFRLIMIFYFSVTDLSSGSGGQFINLDFKRLPSHFICLLIYTFLYWYTERFICFLMYKNLCYIFPSKLRLLEDSCKGMAFVSFSQSNVNKTYWLSRRARYSCLFFTVQIKAEITGGINTT